MLSFHLSKMIIYEFIVVDTLRTIANTIHFACKKRIGSSQPLRCAKKYSTTLQKGSHGHQNRVGTCDPLCCTKKVFVAAQTGFNVSHALFKQKTSPIGLEKHPIHSCVATICALSVIMRERHSPLWPPRHICLRGKHVRIKFVNFFIYLNESGTL